MAFTYGFFDSINGDRLYSSSQLSALFNGIINDGVFASIGELFSVSAPDSGMYVIVGTGRAWFNGIWVNNDSAYPVPRIDDQVVDVQADPQYERIDAVVITIDRSITARTATITYERGIPAPTPQKPTFTDTDYVSYHPIAYITVPPGTTSMKNSKIETAIGKELDTKLVTGILETTSLESLWVQWEGEFDDWMAANASSFSSWWNDMRNVIGGAQLQEYASTSAFPATGDASNLYLALDTNKVYRWTGSAYELVDDFTDASEVIGNLALRLGEVERYSKPYLVNGVYSSTVDIKLSTGSAGWGDSAPYMQTCLVSGIREGDRPIIMPVVPDYNSGIDIDDYLDECSFVTKFEVSDGTVTAWCYEERPTMELIFAVKGR